MHASCNEETTQESIPAVGDFWVKNTQIKLQCMFTTMPEPFYKKNTYAVWLKIRVLTSYLQLTNGVPM